MDRTAPRPQRSIPTPRRRPPPTAPDQYRATSAVKIGLGQRKRFDDPQSGAPPHHDHARSLSPSELSPTARMTAMTPSTDDPSTLPGPTGSEGLFCVATGPGGSREALPANDPPTSTIQQYGPHEVLLRTMIDRIDPCAAGKPTAVRTFRTRPTISVRIVDKAIAGRATDEEQKRSQTRVASPSCSVAASVRHRSRLAILQRSCS